MDISGCWLLFTYIWFMTYNGATAYVPIYQNDPKSVNTNEDLILRGELYYNHKLDGFRDTLIGPKDDLLKTYTPTDKDGGTNVEAMFKKQLFKRAAGGKAAASDELNEAKTTLPEQEDDHYRHIVMDGVKPVAFGANYFNPLSMTFDIPGQESPDHLGHDHDATGDEVCKQNKLRQLILKHLKTNNAQGPRK